MQQKPRYYNVTMFGHRILSQPDAVAERLQQILPAYLAGYSAGAASMAAVPPVPQVETEDKAIHPKHTEADEADHDFSGSVMDFNFMGM